jgi:20S proteasome subunit alpha 4
VVLGCEKRSAMKLQDTRITPSKICKLDHHVVLVDKARVEAQSHRLMLEDPVTIEYATKYIAGIQQRYTQSGGVRPFGISTLVVGFDPNDQTPRLYQTEPSGIYSAWYVESLNQRSGSRSQESKRYRPLGQDGPRVPRAQPQARHGPRGHDPADGALAARGGADGRKEH